MQLHQSLLAALIASSLVACGGSLEGDSSTTDEGTTDTQVTEGEVVTEEDIAVDEAAPAEVGVPSYFMYAGASQSWIAIQGTGGADRHEASAVTFKLLDGNGDPVSGVDVDFSLTAPAGATFEPATGTTDSDGFVSTTVSSGKVSGSVRVNIQTNDGAIKLLSDILSISTGLPDQNSFSLSLEQHAPESMNIDGVLDSVTVRLADKYNNAVPDGTSVHFTTEGGAIRDAETGTVGSCLTVASKCTLVWESQNPRPEGNMLTDGHACAFSAITGIAPCINLGGMGQPYAGRVTITAFTVGEESFTDNDADGWFTPGDTLNADLPEVFYDHNEDGLYKDNASVGIEDDLEEFHDLNLDQAYSSGDGKYNGLLCSAESESLGDCSRDLVNIRADTTLIMASGTQLFRVQQHLGQDVSQAIVIYQPLLLDAKNDLKALVNDEDFLFATAQTNVANAKYAEKVASDAADLDPEDEAKKATLASASKATANAEEVLEAVELRDTYADRLATLNAITVTGSQDSNVADVVLYPRASFTVYIADVFNNRPPSGSVISFEARNGKVLGADSITLPDSNALGPIAMSFVVVPNEPLDAVGFNYLYINVTTPSGIVSRYEIGVSDPVPPPSGD
ncbi:MAG: hypothetical protein GY787_25825 [Alteromonadales bacterium]|nr:hypothetical protein [Alteromonadales bacterium]